jgi:hypothetical protein
MERCDAIGRLYVCAGLGHRALFLYAHESRDLMFMTTMSDYLGAPNISRFSRMAFIRDPLREASGFQNSRLGLQFASPSFLPWS